MRWRILALLFGARVALGVQFQTMAAAGDGLAAAFGLGYADLGLMIGLFMAPGLALALPAGFAGRYASDRTLAGAGLAALTIGGLISAAAPDVGLIALGRLVCGAGFLFATLYFTKMVADWFDGREIATAMSVLVMSWPFGIAMGQVGHTWLAEAYGWRAPFFAASAYGALAALAVVALYRVPDGAPRRAARGGGGLLPREWALIGCAGAAWGVFNAGYVIYLSFGPTALEAQGMTTLAAASVISVGSWIMIVSGAACGQIADRFGRSGLILGVSMATAAGASLLLLTPGAGLAASILIGLIGMAPAGVIMAMFGQAVAPERRALGMGLFLTIYFAILTAGPPAAGWLMDRTGAPTAAIVLGAAMFALVLPAAWLFRILKRRPAAAPMHEAA